MNEGIDRHRETFREEASELLCELESALLELEERPEDAELVGRVFRAMHTIKGSGAMFGFDRITKFTHDIETAFDLVRNGEIQVTKELIDLTLQGRDKIREMLDDVSGGSSEDSVTQTITASLKALIAGAGSDTPSARHLPATSDHGTPNVSTDVGGESVAYRVRFRPSERIFLTGTNPLSLLKELRQLGEYRVIGHTEAIPQLEALDPELCYTSWDILLSTTAGIEAIRDVFIFIEDDCELKVEMIDDAGGPDGHKRLGEILMERGDIADADLERVLANQKRLGELLVEEKVVPKEKIESALMEQRHIKELREKREASEAASSIRVPSARLDSLVNLVGELVTVQARLSQTSDRRNDAELIALAEEVERLTAELRDNTMGIRMLPIGTTFSKFKRLVRDLSAELGKEVELSTDGAETELDKTVIERLNDPLIHLIRNSIDHGIEKPETREDNGKPRKGTIHLSARHSGANVLIQISDDGRGIDPAAVRAKAVEGGLIAADAVLSEKELFSLILVPGFSTATAVTDVSGRGVGMDVVKRAIDNLRGTIEIDSSKGCGTVITLQLPLTLAIIEGLLVTIGEGNFVLPLSSVEECVELTSDDVERSHGRCLANIRGEIVPYINLRERFAMTAERPAIEQIVIVGVNDRRIGFVVDRVVGEHQTVIKSLGRFYREAEGLSGATLLGDGTVALILDIPGLIMGVEQEEPGGVGAAS